MLTFTDHWIDQARRVPSPNFNERPDPDDIALVVIHNISLPPERFGGAHIEARLGCIQRAAPLRARELRR